MLNSLIQQVKNDGQYFFNLAKRTIYYFRTLDPQLYNNCKSVDETLFISYILKGSYNLCLHVTDLGRLSVQLTILLFTTTSDEQAFILASLISVGSRVFGPQYFKIIEDDPVYCKKETLFIEKCGNFCDDKFEGAILMLQQGLSGILNLKDNEDRLIELVEYLHRNYKKLRARKPEKYDGDSVLSSLTSSI